MKFFRRYKCWFCKDRESVRIFGLDEFQPCPSCQKELYKKNIRRKIEERNHNLEDRRQEIDMKSLPVETCNNIYPICPRCILNLCDLNKELRSQLEKTKITIGVVRHTEGVSCRSDCSFCDRTSNNYLFLLNYQEANELYQALQQEEDSKDEKV